jgi:hypothetical protein
VLRRSARTAFARAELDFQVWIIDNPNNAHAMMGEKAMRAKKDRKRGAEVTRSHRMRLGE